MQRISVRQTVGTEPVSLAEIKSRLRITSTLDDAYLTSAIKEAREYAETLTRRTIVKQKLTASIDFCGAPPKGSDPWWDGIRQGSILMFTPGYITLLCPPVSEIEQIRTYDINDTVSTYAASNYRLDKSDPMQMARVVLTYGAIWPAAMRSLNSIEIDFVAGFEDGAVPSIFKSAISGIVAWMYVNRVPCDDGCAQACGAMAVLSPLVLMQIGPT